MTSDETEHPSPEDHPFPRVLALRACGAGGGFARQNCTPDHNWTINIGGCTYGLQGYDANLRERGAFFRSHTVLCYGSGSKRIYIPFYGSVAIGAGTVSVLCVIGLALPPSYSAQSILRNQMANPEPLHECGGGAAICYLEKWVRVRHRWFDPEIRVIEPSENLRSTGLDANSDYYSLSRQSEREQNLSQERIGRNLLTDRKCIIKFALAVKVRIPS